MSRIVNQKCGIYCAESIKRRVLNQHYLIQQNDSSQRMGRSKVWRLKPNNRLPWSLYSNSRLSYDVESRGGRSQFKISVIYGRRILKARVFLPGLALL